MLKTGKKGIKSDNNDGSNRIATLSGVTVLGFCHWYSCHSNLFRASCFGPPWRESL